MVLKSAIIPCYFILVKEKQHLTILNSIDKQHQNNSNSCKSLMLVTHLYISSYTRETYIEHEGE